MATWECKSLCKRYGNVQALDNVSFVVEPGRVVGLLGPNGSGKTTLIKLANGLLTPTGGELLINGQKPGKTTRAQVSYLPDRPCLPEWMSAEKLLNMFADFYADFQRDKAQEMLEKLGIDPKQKIKQMSKGTREKVQLILVMSRKAELYLLDEPIGGVDPAARDYILNTIINNYDPSATVLISTHLISDVERVLDEFLFLYQGRVIQKGEADAVREETGKSLDELFREVFKCLPNC